MDGSKKALIFGKGMDGQHLREQLIEKDYFIYITNDRLSKPEIRALINRLSPTEIYNFAGYSNVFSPFNNLQEIIDSNLVLPKNILESMHELNSPARFFHASSCLIFGKNEGPQHEYSEINPIYTYGAVKYAAQCLVKEFRYIGLFASSGILFPHESYLRGEKFFTKKVCAAAARIKKGSNEKIKVGNLSATRDWSYSPDITHAAWLMLQHDYATDFVIGSGVTYTTKDFIQKAFEYVELDYHDHIEVDDSLFRINDVNSMWADTSKIKSELGWTPTHNLDQIIAKMIDHELKLHTV